MNCSELHDWKFWVAMSATALIDYFVGKTQKTQASSILELIELSLISAGIWIFWKLKTKGNQNE